MFSKKIATFVPVATHHNIKTTDNMSKTIKIMSLIAILCSMLSCNAQTRKYRSMTVDEYERSIADSNVVRVDVRTAEEFAEGHIAGSINIDVLKSDFETMAKSTLPKNKTIAVNCRSGKRSKTAAGILARNGYKVIELDSGYNGWVSSGKPIAK